MSDWSPSARQVERDATRRRMRLRSATIATVATVIVLGVLAWVVTASPGWPRVRETFFSWEDAKDSFPTVIKGFAKNVLLFMIAEPLILVLGATVAVVRSTTSAALFPLRLLATFYTDLFRGVPTLLVVYLAGFGIPALQLQGITNDVFWLGLFALVLSYGAYVAEVFRSGIDSIHPSQVASADALGLSHGQAMRYVVLPQAVRVALPPLGNYGIGLLKDTSIASIIAAPDLMLRAKDLASSSFMPMQLYVLAAVLYFAMSYPLSLLVGRLERRLARSR